MDAVLAGDPTSKVQTTAAFIDAQGAQVNQLLVLLYGLLGMSVLVALVGIINTMSLSIFERRRELGLLRAIGTTRSQLRRTIRYESGLVAAVGATGGILLGLFFGYLAAHAIDETFPDLAVPWLRIAVIGAAGVLAGVGAALLPARRAARLDVLEAIASGG
jgi:putative ABC transport system permease protein